MDTDFVTWLTQELESRDWSNSDLARRAGLVPSTISTIISRKNKPGLDFCVKIARALGYPPERVLREAGLLPPAPSEDEPEYRELLEVAKNLSNEELRNALEYLRWRYRLQVERAAREKPESEEDQ